MTHTSISFSQQKVDYYFNASFKKLASLTDKKNSVIITDDHVFEAHKERFRGWNVISLKPGEAYKIQPTVDAVIDTLIAMGADRKTTLVGVGGGVITDLTGYIASVYMRGIAFGFVPTSLLAMVDAAIGGKNGIDVGDYKNLVGVIRQPKFLLYDTSFLKTLPALHWSDGFAEIIKHACIKDRPLFAVLENEDISTIQKKLPLLTSIVEKNARLKSTVVKKDEFEKGDRKLLNFGHTLGHAIETQYEITHGQAVSIGMHYACRLSEQLTGFKEVLRVDALLTQYDLPTDANFKMQKVIGIMKMDKKRVMQTMHYILLNRIGKGVIQEIPLNKLEKMLLNLAR